MDSLSALLGAEWGHISHSLYMGCQIRLESLHPDKSLFKTCRNTIQAALAAKGLAEKPRGQARSYKGQSKSGELELLDYAEEVIPTRVHVMSSVSQDKGLPEPASDATPRLSRRVVLAGLLSVYTASLVPWAVAQSAPDADRGNFLALSALIAGRQSLDNDLAMRYYDALVAADPGFTSAVTALLTLINQQQVDPLQLQTMLDENHPELAGVPRKVATAWFLGMVEAGDGVKVLAYEEALNAEVVSDVLRPPSYCLGGYGSWANKPT